jgi:hypothetical protein
MNAWFAVGVGDEHPGMCASIISNSNNHFCLNSSNRTVLNSNVQPASATVTWSIPWGWTYYTSNNNRRLTITGIGNNSTIGLHNVRATIRWNGQTITRNTTILVDPCLPDLPILEPLQNFTIQDSTQIEVTEIDQELYDQAKLLKDQKLSENYRMKVDYILNNFNNKLGLQESIQLFPNPASDRVLITTKYSKIFELQIFDALGQRLEASYELSNNKLILNSESLLAGSYKLKIITKNKVFIKNLIKK